MPFFANIMLRKKDTSADSFTAKNPIVLEMIILSGHLGGTVS